MKDIESLSVLKIHKLTQEQFDRESAAGNIDETAIYLTPDNYATKDYVDSHLSGGITRVITDTLPSEPSENVIYMIPSQNSTENNVYDEYMFFNYNGMLIPEIIGSTAVDLSGYLPLSGGAIEGSILLTDEEGYVSGHIDASGATFYAPGFESSFSAGSLRLAAGGEYIHIENSTVDGSDNAKAAWQQWLEVGGGADLSNYYTKAEVDDITKYFVHSDTLASDYYNYKYIDQLVEAIQTHYSTYEYLHETFYTKLGTEEYVDAKIGDIETVLDNIIAIQNQLIGGGA